MSKLMYNPNDGGFTHIYDAEMDAAVKNGWVDGALIRQQMIAAKSVDTVIYEPVADAPKKRGRPFGIK